MARVTVETRAFYEPRIRVAAQAMRMAWASLGWKLAHLWSFVIDVGDSRMALDQIAMCIGRKVPVVRRALVCAELALECDIHTLDLEPMRALFGDFEWLEENAPRPRRVARRALVRPSETRTGGSSTAMCAAM